MLYNMILQALTEAADDEDDKKKKKTKANKKDEDDQLADAQDDTDTTDEKNDNPEDDADQKTDDEPKDDAKTEDEEDGKDDNPEDEKPTEDNPDENTGEDDFNFDDDTTDDSGDNPDNLVDPNDDGSGDELDTEEEKNVQTNVLTNMSSLDRVLAKRKSYQNFMDLRASVVSLRTRIENNEASIDPTVRDSAIEDLNSVYTTIDSYIINRFTYVNYEDTLTMYLLLVKKVNDITDYVKDKRINKDKK